MADKQNRPIHDGAPAPAAAPVRPTALCLSCGAPSHQGVACVDPEVRRLRQRVRELEAELRSVRAEVAADVAARSAAKDDYRALVDDLLTVWQGYTDGQFAKATGSKRLVLADRSQTFLDVKMALQHPKTIEWPEGHPRRKSVAR